MYLRGKIEELLDKNIDKLTGSISYRAFVGRLKKVFKDDTLCFKYQKYDGINVDDYSISGIFDMNKNKRYVVMHFSDLTDKIILNRFDYGHFKFLMSQTIQHETIHRDQWQYRPAVEGPVSVDFREKRSTNKQEIEYLSDIDEIDAYAHDIVLEMKYYYPGQDLFKLLKQLNKLKKIDTFKYYKRTFKNSEYWSLIKKLLLTKTYKWITYA